MSRYDVIIVGGGPAGASAAYWLTQAGRQVLVLEKARLPRYKTCGGAVPLAAMSALPFDFEPTIQARVRQIHFSMAPHSDITCPLPGPGMPMVMRAQFDTFLLDHAGAELRDGIEVSRIVEDETGVTVTSSGGENLHARYLVGADGATSCVAHSLGLRRAPMLAGAVETEVVADDRLLARYESTALVRFGVLRYGYSWVFPKATHLSVGAGALWRQSLRLKTVLQLEAARLGLNLDGAVIHGHPLPIYWRQERLHARHTVLVGDAAGLVDGLMGEGIRYAIRSGKLAAESIIADSIAGYSDAVHARLGPDLTWARRCGRSLYAVIDLAYRFSLSDSHLMPFLNDVLDNRRTYQEVFWRFPQFVAESLIGRIVSPQVRGSDGQSSSSPH
jgi:geranylgeranyl reductase family protein